MGGGPRATVRTGVTPKRDGTRLAKRSTMAADSTVRNVSGFVGGALLAPWTGLVSWARRGRMFHPTGTVFSAQVHAVAEDPAERAVAERLAGPALMRWSAAWWKQKQWPDVLGCAIRFTHHPLQAHARDGDQDLLFATIRRPWTMLLSPLTTNHRDYLANDYYAVSPFEVEELGRIEWRLKPSNPSPPADSRAERLLAAVSSHAASVTLEYAPYRAPLRITDESPFRPLVRIEPLEIAPINQDVLRFDPFHADRGIHPVGFVQWLRKATYASSRLHPHSAWTGAGAGEFGPPNFVP